MASECAGEHVVSHWLRAAVVVPVPVLKQNDVNYVIVQLTDGTPIGHLGLAARRLADRILYKCACVFV